jgi:hypothetical protein
MAFRLIFSRFAAIICCTVALTPATAFAVAWNRMATVDNATATNTALCTWSTTGAGTLECSSANPYIVGGFLGIGSSSPVNALDIGTSQGIRIATGTPTNTAYALYNNAGTLTWNGSPISGLSAGGSTNYDAIWTSPTTIGTGLIYESGGQVGIGGAPGYQFDNQMTATGTTGNIYAARDNLTVTPTGTSTASYNAINNNVVSTSTNLVNAVLTAASNAVNNTGTATIGTGQGTLNAVLNASTGQITNAYGSNSYAKNSLTGTITNAYGTVSSVQNVSTGTVTFAYGAANSVQNMSTGSISGAWGTLSRINNTAASGGAIGNAYSLQADYINSGTTSIGSWYGLYVPPITGAAPTTGRYPLYLADTGTSYIAGNVGIGTTAPAYYLDVSPSSVTGELASFGTGLGATNSSFMGLSGNRSLFGYNGSTTNAVVQGGSGKGIEFDVNNITFGSGTAMVIGTSGNVGIGTTSPANKLDVSGGEAIGAAYVGTNTAPANGAIIQGNVGVGTTSPAAGAKVDVAGPVKVAGTGSESCGAAQVGMIRYNPTGQYFEVCNYP